MQWNYLLNMLSQLDYYKILKYVFFLYNYKVL